MSNDQPTKREAMSIEETIISNMWEIAAIVEVLERKGLCTKQELHTIIDDILELLNKSGLTSHQSQNLLERLGRIIEMGQRVAKGTTH
jgi:hypothetical protein